MMKKTPSRNQRTSSRGIKGKHVLQICVLLGVCVWLIYQVKYSHDKKKEFYEKDVEASTGSQNEDVMVKLGRKDLPNLQYVGKDERHEEEEEEDVPDEVIRRGDEEEKEMENKHKAANERRGEEEKEGEEEEEEEEEEKNKQGREEDEVDDEENKHGEEQELEDDDKQNGGDVEDDIDEQDQETTGAIDGDDEFLEDEKEREGENGVKKNESIGRDEDNSQDEINKTVHEAREEHYKADDASSAVSHETQVVTSENSDAKVAGVTVEQENNSINTSEIKMEPHKSLLKVGEAEAGNSINTTNTEAKVDESQSSDSDIRREARSDDHPEANSMTTEGRKETDNGNSTVTNLEASKLVQNGTEIGLDWTQAHNETEADTDRPVASNVQNIELKQSHDSSTRISANTENKDSIEGRPVNSTSESGLLEKFTGSNTTEVKENTVSLTENKEDRRANGETGREESSNLSSTIHKTDAADETTMSREEREALTDPGTLPNIRTEGTNNEQIAAE